MVKVYCAPFARSLRVLWTLEELGAPYEAVRVQFPPKAADPGYLDINPLGQIPTVIDDDVKLHESVGICEYLAEKYGDKTLVSVAGQPCRPGYLQWLWFGEATLMPALGGMIRHSMGPEEGRSALLLAQARAQFLERLGPLDTALEGHDYLAGDRFTLADVSVGYALNLGTLFKLTDEYPTNVAAYFQRLQQRPAFQRAVAQA